MVLATDDPGQRQRECGVQKELSEQYGGSNNVCRRARSRVPLFKQSNVPRAPRVCRELPHRSVAFALTRPPTHAKTGSAANCVIKQKATVSGNERP